MNKTNKLFKYFSLTDISTYRSELMGCAILWIMMLHFTFTQIKPLGFIAQYGFAGVEIFMFVSGFGLFSSLDRNSDYKRFYRKRLLRIFPTYYILGIFASILLFHDSLFTYLFRYTTIGFWTGGIYWEWYIPSIVLLYLITPFLKFFFDKHWFCLISAITIATLLSAWLVIDKEQILDRSHFFLLYRVSAFIFGMTCAYWLNHNINCKYYILLLVAGIPLFIIMFPHHHQIYNYKYYSLLFLLPLFILAFTFITKYFKFTNPILSSIGKASLETYLIQCIFFHAIITEQISISQQWHDVITISLILLCSILGITAHWAIERSGINRLI